MVLQTPDAIYSTSVLHKIYTKAAHPTDVSIPFMHLSCRAAFSCECMDDSLFKRKAHSRFGSTRVLQKENERKWMRVIRSHHGNLYITPSSSETAVLCCSQYFLSLYVLPILQAAMGHGRGPPS